MIHISETNSVYEREALLKPFGFKGGQLTELWQSVVKLTSRSGASGIGLGTQSVLWSDARVFTDHSEADGNHLMYALTKETLSRIQGSSFETPMDLLDNIVDEVYECGQRITKHPDLRKTFALNALVALDNAAWLLYASEKNIKDFDDLIPPAYRPVLSQHHSRVASIPLINYNTPADDIEAMVNQGFYILKIKIGQAGSQKEMLVKDKDRLTTIHRAIGHKATDLTKLGKPLYYLDANSRYQEKETLLSFLDHARKIGAWDQILLIEEPFSETSDLEVCDIEKTVAADESAHTDRDALERIQMGYRAIALKPVAKTLSMTLKIAKIAYENNIACFCADLTVNPILAEWNRAVAARLSAIPGLDLGLMEANGQQNYQNWESLTSYHPYAHAAWIKPVNGIYRLDKKYYEKSGGLFEPSSHYQELIHSICD